MATRSIIGARLNGQDVSIYCHYDGYPSHVFETLVDYYSDVKQIEKLINLGDLSSLYASPDKGEGHSFDNRVDGYCVAYHRDRGEPWDQVAPRNCHPKHYPNSGQEYYYYWDGETWSWSEVDWP